MPSLASGIGATAVIYVPDDDQQIALGYTGVRVYWAASETAAPSLVTTLALVSGQRDYEYNKADALSTDWVEWCLYGAVPGEGPRSERGPVGPPQVTRLQVRQGVGRRLQMVDVVTVAGSPAPTTTAFCATNLIDADASAFKFANRHARLADGTTRRVRQTGYAPASGVITVNAFPLAPVAADQIELWKPYGDADVSALIDEATARARTWLWWEETYYLSVDDNVTEYEMPSFMLNNSIKRVEYASDLYPSRPGWLSVGWWRLTDGVLSVLCEGSRERGYSRGTVIRVVCNRHGERLAADSDVWSVDLEWAVAEVAVEFVKVLRTPFVDKDEIADISASYDTLMQDVRWLRSLLMPAVGGTVQVAR